MKKPLLLALLATACIASAQTADQKDFYFHASDVALLQIKTVQAELKITEAQRARMNTFAERHRAHLQALQDEYTKNKKDPQTAQQDPRLIGFFIELKKNVLSQLTFVQVKRLGELSLQHLGLASLTDDKVGARVGMSKDQILKMRKTFQDGSTTYAAAEKAAAQPVLDKYKSKNAKDKAAADAIQKQFDKDLQAVMTKAKPKLLAIQSATEKKMRAIMTAQQTTAYKALLGTPFKG